MPASETWRLPATVVGVGDYGLAALREMASLFTRFDAPLLPDEQGIEFRRAYIDPAILEIDPDRWAFQPFPGSPGLLSATSAYPENFQATSNLFATPIVFVVVQSNTPNTARLIHALAERAGTLGACTILLDGSPCSDVDTAQAAENGETGLALLKKCVDAIIPVPADDCRASGKCIEMMLTSAALPGLIGLDLWDIVLALTNRLPGVGTAAMVSPLATGLAEGADRAVKAMAIALQALGAHATTADGIVIKFSAEKKTMRMAEINQAMKILREHVPDDSLIAFASPFDENYRGPFRIDVLASRWGNPRQADQFDLPRFLNDKNEPLS